MSAFSPATLIGPKQSSGVENLVSRTLNFLPPSQRSSESSNKDFAVPGGPTRSRCSPATSAVKARAISQGLRLTARPDSCGEVDFVKGSALGFAAAYPAVSLHGMKH